MFEECGKPVDDGACLFYKLTYEPKGSGELKMSCCCCLFGFNVAFNKFSVISRRCLVVTGSSMLTFIVLPH